ncbi:LysR family transcriptional regulator [Dysosmobacter sp.]
MNFLPMRYFIAMADQKSISKAVRQLHIIQQTLSAHIRGRVWMPALIAA